MLRLVTAPDRWLFAPADPASARRIDRAARALAVVLAVRIALGPYRALAGQPDVLFRPPPFLTALPGMPPGWVLLLLQVVGVAAAVVAALRPGRLSLPVAWLTLLVLAGLRGSLGKILHNDVLLLLATVPFVIRAVATRARDPRPWPARAALVVISAAYFFSGYQKLLRSGLVAWVFSDNFRWVLYGGAASGRAPTTAVARAIADRPGLAVACAALLLSLELTFPLVLFAPRLRRTYGAAAIVMHAGTWLTLGLDYWPWVAVDAVVLLYAAAPITAKDSAPPRARSRSAAPADPDKDRGRRTPAR